MAKLTISIAIILAVSAAGIAAWFDQRTVHGFEQTEGPQQPQPLFWAECSACGARSYYGGPPPVHVRAGETERKSWYPFDMANPPIREHDCPNHPNSFQK